MAHPQVVPPANQSTHIRSQKHQNVSSQIFATAPSGHPSIFSMPNVCNAANLMTSIPTGMSVAPASAVASRPIFQCLFFTYIVCQSQHQTPLKCIAILAAQQLQIQLMRRVV